jgi:hypothetical protein
MRQLWFVLLVMMLALVTVGCNVPVNHSKPRTAYATSHTTARTPQLSALDLLSNAIGERHLVLLGEIHGTRETPALVSSLLDRESARGSKVILGLEIAATDQTDVDRYLRSSGSPADRATLLSGSHWRDPMHDGRDSAAMFDLIEHVRSLRQHGHDVAIAFFDPGNADDRNRGIANNLRDVVSGARGAKVLVLTGNVHAMTGMPPQMFDGGKRIDPPMTAGRLLADFRPFSIEIEASTGEAWNCTGTCGVHRVRSRDQGASAPSLELQGEDAPWDAMLLLPEFSASRPAIEALL